MTALDDLAAAYELVKGIEPVEPMRLTLAQWDWVKARLEPREPSARNGFQLFDPSPLWATPVVIVDRVEDSTPRLKGWAGWPA